MNLLKRIKKETGAQYGTRHGAQFAHIAKRGKVLREQRSVLENAYRKAREANALIKTKNRELKKQIEKMAARDQYKSHFFASISNEFRNPLSLIIGPLEQILEEKPGKDLEPRLNLILDNANRTLNLVEQLLELSKFEQDKMILRPVEQDISGFLKGIVKNFQPLALQKQIHLDFRDPGKIIPLYFDPEKIERILFNLLSNSINSTNSGGNTQLSIWQVGATANTPGYVEISIRDNGAVIPPAQLPFIFDLEYQEQCSPEHRWEGGNVVLPLTRKLVELHHGNIEVRSNCQPGIKWRKEFFVRLPMGRIHFQPGEIINATQNEHYIDHELVLPAKKTETAIESGGLDNLQNPVHKPAVLIIDDNSDIRTYVRSILEPQFNVTEAEDGMEGISKAWELLPDLVISDIMMPEVDGYDVCRRIKEDIHTSHIPVIMLTARASEKNIVQGLECQADDYITKPFSARILNGRVKNLIHQRRQLQKRFLNEILPLPGEISASSLDQKFMDELIAKIEEYLADPNFGVTKLALELFMSQSALYKKVEALTGQSPQLFIRSYRLTRAAQLLKANSGNVTEVAFAVGFSSASYFTKCFKKKFGKRPSGW